MRNRVVEVLLMAVVGISLSIVIVAVVYIACGLGARPPGP